MIKLWFAFCSPGQPKPCSSLCGASYRANTQIWSCVKLHAGGPSLAPNPAAYRIQGRLHGVAMSIGPHSDLPNRPLSTCIGFSKKSLSALIGEGVALSPFRPYHYHALVLLWPRRYGIASLLRYASYQGHFQTHSIIN